MKVAMKTTGLWNAIFQYGWLVVGLLVFFALLLARIW
jgi:hypothetical protein